MASLYECLCIVHTTLLHPLSSVLLRKVHCLSALHKARQCFSMSEGRGLLRSEVGLFLYRSPSSRMFAENYEACKHGREKLGNSFTISMKDRMEESLFPKSFCNYHVAAVMSAKHVRCEGLQFSFLAGTSGDSCRWFSRNCILSMNSRVQIVF